MTSGRTVSSSPANTSYRRLDRSFWPPASRWRHGRALLAEHKATADKSQPLPGIAAHFSRYAGLFAFTVIGIVLFDVFQAFFDYGAYKTWDDE